MTLTLSIQSVTIVYGNLEILDEVQLFQKFYITYFFLSFKRFPNTVA